MMHAPSTAYRTPHVPEPAPTGGRLVSPGGRALPLLGASLTAEAVAGIARVTLSQRFHNPHAEPLAVTYSLPLPADGAVSGFSFRVGGRRVVGEIDRRREARERYEQALVEGRSAALLEQDRSSLFTQEIGNIPPGEEVVVEVVVDQRLRWIDEGAWEWRFPTVVSPRYLGQAGRVPDADRIAQEVSDGPLDARFTLWCSIRDALARGARPESPSHTLDSSTAGGTLRVELDAANGARLDRDVVLRWKVATPRVGLALELCRSDRPALSADAHGLLTIVPPSPDARTPRVHRDLIVLLDTSGSMGGAPLEQAVRVTQALVDTLRADDRLELIEFSSSARRWKHGPVAATESARREALRWLRDLRASGSTEMRTGILAALGGVRAGAQRQVVLITDGQIGFESEVVSAICDRLPASSRLHTVGVGSAVNRSLTGPAARAGHGVEVVIGLGEDPERAASRLVSRTDAPLLVDVTLGGSALVDHAPARLPDLFAGAPALIGLSLRPEGGHLTVRGRTLDGTWEQRLEVPALAVGQGNAAVAALYGREAVEDLELRLAAGGRARDVDADIERLGVDFQIATRLTSWIAVSQEQTVDPRDPLRRQRMPHELPYGVSAEGLGLRPSTLQTSTAVLSSPPLEMLGELVDDDEDFGPPPGFGAPPPQGGPPPRYAAGAAASAGAPPPAAKKIDVKARLGDTSTRVTASPARTRTRDDASYLDAPMSPPQQSIRIESPAAPPAAGQPQKSSMSASQQSIRVESPEEPLARRKRTTPWTLWLVVLLLLALAVAAWLLLRP